MEGFILLIMSSTSRWEMLARQRRGWEITGRGVVLRAGGEEWDRADLMLFTFDLNASRMLLQWSTVMLLWAGDWGCRKLFMVEKSFFEFPGVLLIMLE